MNRTTMEDLPNTGSLTCSYPKWVVIQLVEQCNLRCRMCYEWGREGTYHSKGELASLSLEIVKQVIADCSPGRPYLGLFGGEPLMYPALDQVLALVREQGLQVDIPTNGTLLQQHGEMLVETRPNRLWVSLDGPAEINDRQRGAGVYRKVLEGIETLFEIRQRRRSAWPKIGITMIVTPLNYLSIEKLFLECLDLAKLDQISIEFQLYTTREQYAKHRAVMEAEFGVTQTPCAQGMIWDQSEFQTIDLEELTRQIKTVAQACQARGIYFITYPKTVTPENLAPFYLGNWTEMADYHKRCTFPWVYAEINARGDVSTCHTFYDLTHGNVYRQGILEIWRNASLEKFRGYMRKNLLPLCTACSRYYRDPNKK